jgi:hypothetical protein
MKPLQFVAIVLMAVSLVPGGAHVASLLNKIALSEANYFIVQAVYRGWDLFGAVLIASLVVNLALAVAVRAQTVPLRLVLIALVCQVGGLAIFLAYPFPANQATANWTEMPDNWEALRSRWEYGHAVNAVTTFVGLCAVTLAALTAPTKSRS